MYTDVSTAEYFTESPRHPYSEQSSTVKYQSTPKSKIVLVEATTVPPPKTSVPPRWTPFVPPPKRSVPHHWTPFKPEIVSELWPPLVTEIPKETKRGNPFNTVVLSVVLVVVIFWIGVTGVLLRNKIRAKRERRRAREPPSYSANLFSSNTAHPSAPSTHPSFELREMSDFTVIDIASAAHESSSFGYQPSAPSQATAENFFPPEQPPTYTEVQKGNSQILKSNTQEQPPSYEEAQLQRVMQESGS